MPWARLYIATFAAYLPASSLAALATRTDVGGPGPMDPGVLVVPFCAAFAVGFPLAGLLADRVDRRRLIAGALLLLGLAGGVVAAATSEGAVVAGRALEGFAAAGIPPAAQAELTRRSGDARAGRAVGGMMIAVALATLGGPLLALAAAGAAGWSGAVLALGVAAPVAAAAVVLGARGQAVAMRDVDAVRGGPFRPTAPVLAGWAVAFLVLAGYWTVLTRLPAMLAEGSLGGDDSLAALAPLIGALGIPLVVLAARACDRFGPRAPMALTLLAGVAGFGAAATASGPAAFVACAGVGLAAYWAYLPVVSVQVQRSAAPGERGRAVGGLYASMWLGAAAAAGAAALAPSWRVVVAGATLSWLVAAIVAWRGFLSRPAGAPSSAPWPSPHRPLAPAPR